MSINQLKVGKINTTYLWIKSATTSTFLTNLRRLKIGPTNATFSNQGKRIFSFSDLQNKIVKFEKLKGKEKDIVSSYHSKSVFYKIFASICFSVFNHSQVPEIVLFHARIIRFLFHIHNSL